MVKNVMLIGLICLLTLFSAQEVLTDTQLSGTIYYRDGSGVAFTEIGMQSTTLVYKVEGKLDPKEVTYYFSELSQIHFLENNKGYYVTSSKEHIGNIRVVDRSGNAFVINDAYIEIGFLKAPEISYRYFDEAAKAYKWRSSKILNNISYITFD